MRHAPPLWRGHRSPQPGLAKAARRSSSHPVVEREARKRLDTRQAVAVVAGGGVAERDKVWPFEIITIGGDDVLLFVPADRARALAASIAREFGTAMKGYGTNITLSWRECWPSLQPLHRS